jgi:hypothetical protein
MGLGAGKFVGIVRCPTPTRPNFQMRVSQLGRFHWPDLEIACRASALMFAR